MKALFALIAALALAGCAAPTVDWTHADQQCSVHCSDAYNQCVSGFTMTPFLQKLNCNDSFKLCAAACGGKVASN